MNEDLINLTDLFDEFYLITEPLLNDKQNLPNLPGIQPAVEQNNQSVLIVSEPNAIDNQAVFTKPSIVFKGANKRHITIIYNDKLNDSSDNVLLISNLVIKGLNISMDDVAVCRLSNNENATLTDFFEQLQPQKAILWGCNDLLLAAGLVTAEHAIMDYQNAKVLLANAVHTYHPSNALKQQLWLKVKELFNT